MGKANKFELIKNLERNQRLLLQLGLLPSEIVEKINPTVRKKRLKRKLPQIAKSDSKVKSHVKLKKKKIQLAAEPAEFETIKKGIKKTRRSKKMRIEMNISKDPKENIHHVEAEPVVKLKKKGKNKKILRPSEEMELKTVEKGIKRTKRIKKLRIEGNISEDPTENIHTFEPEPPQKVPKFVSPFDKNFPSQSTQETPLMTKKILKTSSTLHEKVTEKLKGARFRYINESLYTTTGTEAMQMFTDDPSAFAAYHEGYTMQKNNWPVDPLDLIIKQLKNLSDKAVVVDMGCGDARLSDSIPQKVYSFDLLSLNDKVTACDMANVPLTNESVDVCVYCLSLMGTNLADYLMEANRILKSGGSVKIVEISSRFSSKKDFRRSVEKFGFHLLKQTQPNDYFIQMDFEKVGKVTNKRPPGLNLKPCRYKKR